MTRTAIIAACALACAVLSTSPADARHGHRTAACTETGDVMRPVCGTAQASPVTLGNLPPGAVIRVTMHRDRHAEIAPQIVGGRPPGCPSRFCGCGASLHLFGRIVPGLNLAANWLRFPRTAPAPKMAAARRGHVFVLEQHISGDVWLVYDANSGGHQTRVHARSIAGYAIVNPMGAG